ncbi:MAG: ABC transporter ATP-binding protein [Chthoniobacterales bacterium]|jgi:predicted ABC-type transport system involved in lysophospholipase L1 biosynthesis ATPase subunit
MADEIHLRARGLHKAFRLGSSNLEILRGVDLDVKRGERVFLCGASGAGKSTLLYTLAGLERPTSGEVCFEGQDLYRVSAARQAALRNTRMGFVFQSYMLLPELTALENVALPGLIGGRPDRDRAGQLLEGVGLGDRAGHLPSELSGGEQQRVAMARALANRPTMLFADEPTGNLDSKTGGEIVDLLLGLTRANGTTLLAVTHDAELAARGDRVLHIRDGQLEES